MNAKSSIPRTVTIEKFLARVGCFDITHSHETTFRYVNPAGEFNSLIKHQNGSFTEIVGSEVHHHRNFEALKASKGEVV